MADRSPRKTPRQRGFRRGIVAVEMNEQRTVQRRTWHALSPEEKQERLAALRHRQQRQIEVELRMLSHAWSRLPQ